MAKNKLHSNTHRERTLIKMPIIQLVFENPISSKKCNPSSICMDLYSFYVSNNTHHLFKESKKCLYFCCCWFLMFQSFLRLVIGPRNQFTIKGTSLRESSSAKLISRFRSTLFNQHFISIFRRNMPLIRISCNVFMLLEQYDSWGMEGRTKFHFAKSLCDERKKESTLQYCQVNVFVSIFAVIVAAWTTNYESIVTYKENGVQKKGDKIKVAKEQNLLFTVDPCILLLCMCVCFVLCCVACQQLKKTTAREKSHFHFGMLCERRERNKYIYSTKRVSEKNTNAKT